MNSNDLSHEELERLSSNLRSLARHLVADDTTADDLVQEAWLAAVESPSGRVRDLNRWLSRVVRNVAARQRRRRTLNRDAENEAARPEAITDSGLRERMRTWRWIQTRVEALAEPYREVMRLRYFEDLSYKQIAERLGRPADTIRTQLQRGLALLRRELDVEHGGKRSAWVLSLSAFLQVEERVRPAPAHSVGVGSLAAIVAALALLATAGWLTWRPASPTESVAAAASEAESIPSATAEAESLPETAEGASRDPLPPPVAREERETTALSLRVERADGSVATGATVHVRSSTGEEIHTGPVDSNGQLVVDVRHDRIRQGLGPPPGVYVWATTPHEAASNSYAVPLPLAHEVTVRTGGPRCLLEGVVLGEVGLTLAEAEIVIGLQPFLQQDEHGVRVGRLERDVLTDDQGWFAFDDLQEGLTTVRITAADHAERVFQEDLTSASPTTRDYELDRGAVAEGRILDEDGLPLAGVRVWATEAWPAPVPETFTDDSGRYRLSGIAPGTRYLCCAHPEDPTAGALERVTLESGEVQDWSPHMDSVPCLRVRAVEQESGHPATPARAAILFETSMDVRELDADGRALFTHLPEHGHKLLVITTRASDALGRPAALVHGVQASADELLVEIGDLRAGLGRVSGDFLTAAGLPLEGVSVELHELEREVIRFTVLEAGGRLALDDLEPGRWQILVLFGEAGLWMPEPFVLSSDGSVDLGSLRAPAAIAVAAEDLAGLEEADGPWKLTAARDALPGGFEGEVLAVFDELPLEWELLPGEYRLASEERSVSFGVR